MTTTRYHIQRTIAGRDDWHYLSSASDISFDFEREADAKEVCLEASEQTEGYEFRVMKRTVIEEVMG